MLASGKTANGGAVFSVDAMSFIDALPIDNYNGAARALMYIKLCGLNRSLKLTRSYC